MREESHLEEMRAALRGDRERAEQARLRSLENVRALIEVPDPAPAEAPDAPDPERPRRGFLSRFRGR